MDADDQDLSYCSACERKSVTFGAIFYIDPETFQDPEAPLGIEHQHFSLCFECGDERAMECPES